MSSFIIYQIPRKREKKLSSPRNTMPFIGTLAFYNVNPKAEKGGLL